LCKTVSNLMLLLFVFLGSLVLCQQPDIINGAQVQEHLNAMDGYPARAAAIHLCLPNTSFSQIIRAGVLLTGRTEYRMRFQTHLDDLHRPETQYRLMTYGIPIQDIPCTNSGVIKIKNNAQWIKSRMELDKMRESGELVEVVIHPGNDSVLFRQGGSKAGHYGNVKFRSLLEEYMEEYVSAGKDRAALKLVRTKVIKQVEAGGGKFLILDKKMNWWIPIADRADLDEKIVSSFYHQAKKMNIPSLSHVSTSKNSLFLQGNKRRKLEGKQLCCSYW
jgi:hypothetical protein